MTRSFLLLACALLLAGCETQVKSNPARTATEELLISTAADHAAERMVVGIPFGSKVFVEAANFDTPDGKYAVSALRAHFLQHNMKMMEKRADADVVIEVRSGALSINQNELLVGLPSFAVPVPFASSALTLPELALYKNSDQEGVAQFTATAYQAKSGEHIADSDAEFGFAHNRSHTVLFVISWASDDIYPKQSSMAQLQNLQH